MSNNKKSPLIAVILKNRIGGLDTVLPLLFEIKKRNPSAQIEFHVFHQPTLEAIKRNVVLCEGAAALGSMPDHNQPSLWVRKGLRILLLLRLAVLGLFGQAVFIHFNDLCNGPLRLLYLAARRRTYYIRDGAYGTPNSLQRVIRRRQQNNVENQSDPLKKIVGIYPVNPDASGLQIFFSQESLQQAGVARDGPLVVVPPPRQFAPWLSYLRSRADGDIDVELRDAGVEPDTEIVAYMVSEPYVSNTHILYGLRAANSLATLFEQTLDILIEESQGRPILIRSQLAIDFPYVEEQIRKRPEAKIILTNLHAGVLATRATIFVTNWVTTTLADAKFVGVPTVEFSDYNDDLLQMFEGGPCCPEWVTNFVNRDPEIFRSEVRQLIEVSARVEHNSEVTEDPSGVLDLLASGNAWSFSDKMRRNSDKCADGRST